MFTRLFGPDFCEYECTKPSKASILSPGQINHDVTDIIEVNDNRVKASASTVKGEGSCNLTNDEDNVSCCVIGEACNLTNDEDDVSCSVIGEGSCNLTNDEDDVSCSVIGEGSCNPTNDEDDVSCSVIGEGSCNLSNDEDDVSCSVIGEGSCNPTNDEDDVSCSVIGEGSCNPTNDQDDVSCSVKKRRLTRADFQNGKLNSLTRSEATAYYLPKVAFIAPGDVAVSKNFTKLFNPLLANGRPSESTVKHAMKLQRTFPNKVVKLGHLGCYNSASLKVFEKMCALESDASNLRQEICWLSQTPEAQTTAKIKDALINSMLHDVILQQGQSIMDLSDFCTLACERYVNSFAIDTTCLTFLKEEKQSNVVYLPCYSQSWAKQGAQFFSQKVSGYFSHCPADAVSIIVTPIHIPSRRHWGILCFDAVNRTAYFDDGLKIVPPRSTVTVVRNMLNGFSVLSDDSRFKLEQWNHPRLCLPLPRINMPQQTTTGVGAGSCGIGVILCVRDIIRSGKCLPPFQWEFKDMGNLRKQLMSQILDWRNKAE